MKRGFYNCKFVLAAVAASIAVGANADDAADVMRASASNESVTVVMPFSPFLPGTPAYFLVGPFMGDGGVFSDMLHVAPADGSTPTNAVHSARSSGRLEIPSLHHLPIVLPRLWCQHLIDHGDACHEY